MKRRLTGGYHGIFAIGLALLAGGFGVRASLAQGDAADPLARKVDLSARSTPIHDLLAKLPPDPGLRLEEKQEVGWERVSVFAKQRPEGEVIHGLGKLLDYGWERRSDRSTGQHLILNDGLHVRQYETKLVNRWLERVGAPLFDLTRYLRIPREEAAKQDHDLHGKEPSDPVLQRGNLWRLGKVGPRAALELFTTLPHQSQLTMIADEQFFLPWSGMNDRQRGLAAELMNAYPEAGSPKPDQNRLKREVEWLQQFGLLLTIETQPATGAITIFTVGTGGRNYGVAQFPERRNDLELLALRGNPYEPPAKPPVYPDLQGMPFPSDFKLEKGKVHTWPEILEKLAGSTDLLLLSDDYSTLSNPRDRSPIGELDLRGLSLDQGLDVLCAQYGRLWWKEGNAICFRSRKWFLERLYEVPPPVRTLLQEELEATGTLDTNGVSALTNLTSRQLQGLSMAAASDTAGLDSVAAWEAQGHARPCHLFLNLFRQLPEGLRRQALSQGGIPGPQLPRQLQQYFLQLICIQRGRQPLEIMDRLRFRVRLGEPEPPTRKNGPWSVTLGFPYGDGEGSSAELQISFTRKQPAENASGS